MSILSKFRKSGLKKVQAKLGSESVCGEDNKECDGESIPQDLPKVIGSEVSTNHNLDNPNASGIGIPFTIMKASQGDAYALYSLGFMYEQGDGVSKDLSKAFALYKEAADLGYARAQFKLGFMYELGIGVPKDYSEAVRWYRMAADQDDDMAQWGLGNCYSQGTGVPQDYSEAIRWYEEAARKGNEDAQWELGDMYYDGKVVPRNLAKAKSWYTLLTCEVEPSIVQYRLGLINEYGGEELRNLSEAVEWYTKAADQGDADAQYSLGFMYEHGEGVSHDSSEAVMWYRMAADQGHDGALGRCYEKGYRGTVNSTGAFEHYTKSAEKGNENSMYFLAGLYERGEGATKDLEKALVWYIKALNGGHIQAKDAVDRCKSAIAYEEENKLFADDEVNGHTLVVLNETSFKNPQITSDQLFDRALGGDAKAFLEISMSDDPKSLLFVGKCYIQGICCSPNLDDAEKVFSRLEDVPSAIDCLGVVHYLKKSYNEADRLFFKAYKMGSMNGAANLAVTKFQIDQCMSVRLLEEASDADVPNAMYNLGLCYYLGEGKENDNTKAFGFFLKAAEKGHVDAMYNVAVCYENGDGTGKDLEKAVFWYTECSKKGDCESDDALACLDRWVPPM